MRVLIRTLGILAAIVIGIVVYGLAEARRDPVVRQMTLALPDWPAGQKPVRAVLLSDVHFGNITMGPTRLARIVDQVQQLKPDIILLAGDFVAGYNAKTADNGAADLAAGLSRLRAPLGVVAVLGNHDHESDPEAVRRTLMAANITLLSNTAITRGPLVIGGVDDQFTRHADIPATLSDMAKLSGAKIILTHTPDVARDLRLPKIMAGLPPIAPQVILAGHTHCGQIVIPGYGPLVKVIDPREHYGCGFYQRGVDRVVVTGGLGTSEVPLRLGAPPDLWVVTLGPAAAQN